MSERKNVFRSNEVGSPIAYANINVLQDDQGIYGRVDLAAARITESGASIDFFVHEGTKLLYSADSAHGFEGVHGVEVGYLGENVMDGRTNGKNTISNLIQLSGDEWLASMVARGGSYSEGGIWFVGERDTTLGVREKLGSLGLHSEALYSVIYYNLAAAAEGEPVIVDSHMTYETTLQLQMLEDAASILRESWRMNQSLAARIDDVAKSELPDIAEDEFTLSRRLAHENEAKFHTLGARSAFGSGMRHFLPTGQGKSGRSWPFMDAGDSDEHAAFGRERELLKRGDRQAVFHSLEREARELTGRFSYLDTIIGSVKALRSRESEAAEQ